MRASDLFHLAVGSLLLASCASTASHEVRAWSACVIEGDPLLLGLAFPTATVGVAVGGTTERGPSVVLRSVDEGATWQAVETGARGRLYDVDFPSASRGFAAGFGVLLRTDDGGRSWRELAMQDDRWLAAVDFVDTSIGYVAGGRGRDAVLWKTENGGITWRALEDRLPPDARVALRDVHFTDERHGYVVGEQGVLCETRDGGETWTRIATDTDAWLRSLHIADDALWIAASPGVLYRVDERSDFTALPHFAGRKTNDVRFVDARRGWVTDFDGRVHATTDGGATWTTSLAIEGTPTCLATLGNTWLFVASDVGMRRMRVAR